MQCIMALFFSFEGLHTQIAYYVCKSWKLHPQQHITNKYHVHLYSTFL